MKRNSYSTDLTDEQWSRIAPWVPEPEPGGRPIDYERREIVNGVFYQTRNGCAWRALPHDLPPYRTVFYYFRQWQKDGTWEKIHDALRERVRKQAGRKPGPSAAILDSQTAKGTEQGGPKGFDGGKKSRRQKTTRRRGHVRLGVGLGHYAGLGAGSRRRQAGARTVSHAR